MTSALPSPSGLPAVDRQWGGFAQGRAYLLVGRAGAGRSALALQSARAAIDEGERCLVISPRAPDALVEIGRGIGLDLAGAHAAGKLRLLRIPSAQDLAARGPEGLAKSYRDLAALVASDRPDRVVIEDFTPLVQFDTFESFRDAFSSLVGALRDQGATLMIGLGDPANDASRQLLDVVESLVDGTIRLGSGGDLILGLPSQPDYPSNDGASSATATPPDAPSAMPTAPVPEPFVPEALPEPEAPAFVPPPAPEAAPPQPPAPTAPPLPLTEAPVIPGFTPTMPASVAPAPQAPVPPPSAAPPPAPSLQAPPPMPAVPQPPPTPADGFATTFSLPAIDDAPPAPLPTSPAVPQPSASASETPGASGPGGPPATEVVPPPRPDPSLLTPTPDTFAYDPADAVFEQGFLADSTGGRVLGTVGQAAPSFDAPPSGALPSFAPLGGAPTAPDPNAAFRTALDGAFAARPSGVPFQVVALRMEPTAPESAHFASVEAGLRSALRIGDALRVDTARKRAAVVLPSSNADAAQALFAGLQSHLRSALGPQAEAVLQSVAAVTIADGQPFQSASDLIAYAIEG